MFTAGFLEAGEGVATLSPDLTPSTGADLAFFHPVSQIVLTAVVMKRQVGAVQHPQQFGLLALEPPQHLIERFAGRCRGAQGLEAAGNAGFNGGVGSLPVGFQVPIQSPDLLPDPGDGLPVRLVQGQQVLQRPFGMDPAQAMNEQIKLPGIVTEHVHLHVKALRHQAADQGTFGGQSHRAAAVDQVAAQVRRPVLGVSHDHRARGQHLAVARRQTPLRHVG